MKRFTLLIFALILAGSAHPAVALIIPDPASDPAVMAAARDFVRTLPIRDFIARGQIVTARLARSLAEESAATRPGSDTGELAGTIAGRLAFRVNRLLPEIWPALEEEITLAYARSMWIQGLRAGAEFFRTPGGMVFAFRTVEQDPLIGEIVYRRLLERLSGLGDEMLAEAAAAERLRQQVNAGRR